MMKMEYSNMHPGVRELMNYLEVDCPGCNDNCCHKEHEPYQVVRYPTIILDSRAEKLVPKELTEVVDGVPMMKAISREIVDETTGMKTIESRCAALELETKRCEVYENGPIICGLFPIQLMPWSRPGAYNKRWFGGVTAHIEPGVCVNMRNIKDMDPELIKELLQRADSIFKSHPTLIERVERFYRQHPEIAETNYVF
jgi:Fe-S-cluster containining protein